MRREQLPWSAGSQQQQGLEVGARLICSMLFGV